MKILVGLVFIIVFVWVTMLAGLVVIFASLPFLASTLSASIGRLAESLTISGTATVMVLVWLTIWKWLAFRYFSSLLSKRKS
jgi:hypothetical protein